MSTTATGIWSLFRKGAGEDRFELVESVALPRDAPLDVLDTLAQQHGLSYNTTPREYEVCYDCTGGGSWVWSPHSPNYPAFEWRFTPGAEQAPDKPGFVLTPGDEAHRYPLENVDDHIVRYVNSRLRYYANVPNDEADRPMSVCLILRCANMPGVEEAAPITVRSSNGNLLVARDGRVVHCESAENPSEVGSLHQILKFNLATEPDDEYDILDLGYWYHNPSTNTVLYEPRVPR